MSRTRRRPKKTPSERLRSVLYKLYMYKMPIGKTFEDFYNDKLELIIKHYKKQIEDETF